MTPETMQRVLMLLMLDIRLLPQGLRQNTLLEALDFIDTPDKESTFVPSGPAKKLILYYKK